MVVFSILKVPMTEWSIGADAQVLFTDIIIRRHGELT